MVKCHFYLMNFNFYFFFFLYIYIERNDTPIGSSSNLTSTSVNHCKLQKLQINYIHKLTHAKCSMKEIEAIVTHKSDMIELKNNGKMFYFEIANDSDKIRVKCYNELFEKFIIYSFTQNSSLFFFLTLFDCS